MTWQRLVICFELQSPLHIGFLPNSPQTVLAPTRRYVPGKNIWGAVTEALTPKMFTSPTPVQYRQIGEEIKNQLYFSYFYLSDVENIFLPAYGQNGLNWGVYDNRVFCARFIESLVSTRIMNQIGSSVDGSLHGIEYIRHFAGSRGEEIQKVFLVGTVWLKEESEILGHPLVICNGSIWCGEVDLFCTLTIGGERNYGFGHLSRVDVPENCKIIMEEILSSSPDNSISLNERQLLIGHLPYRADFIFLGDIEVLAGRAYPSSTGKSTKFINSGKQLTYSGAHFVPGTKIYHANQDYVRMDSWGRFYY